MSEVAEAVFVAFKPEKLNYELLGNLASHLHWHIFPRYKNDPMPNSPIWFIDKAVRCSEKVRPTKAELKVLRNTLLSALK